jgi:hypothetical protein
MCMACRSKYGFGTGRVVHHDHGTIKSTRSYKNEQTRYHLRLQTESAVSELIQFYRPASEATFQFVDGDRLKLLFNRHKQPLLIHNESTKLNIKIRSPRTDALAVAQLVGVALGSLFTCYLWLTSTTSLKTALIGSSVLSLGIGYGVYHRLLPREKDPTNIKCLQSFQYFLRLHQQVNSEIRQLEEIQASDQALMTQLSTQLSSLKERMAAEPSLYEARLEICEKVLSLLEQKAKLVEEQISINKRVLNTVEVDVLTTQITEQLPKAFDADLLEHKAKLEAQQEQIEQMVLEVKAAQSLRLESLR